MRNKRILIIDNEPDINLSLKIFLEENGFEVDTFEDPITALDNFRKGLYDLLILDVVMPKMHGFELYRKIRNMDNEVKICFLTAGQMYYGAYTDIFTQTTFIRKPIQNQDLMKEINEVTNNVTL
jgi:two-component system, OmpR family, response regulator ChvI